MDALTSYDRMRAELINAHRIDEVKDIRDKAEALRKYAQQTGESLENRNMLAEIELRAIRRAGELLIEMKENGEREGHGGDRKSKSTDMTLIQPPKLSELGITKNQSSDWQAVANLPEPEFEQDIEDTKAKKKELTVKQVTQKARQAKKKQERQQQRQGSIESSNSLPDDATLWIGDFRVETTAIPDDSIDFIFTDPPYDEKSIPLYGDLARVAARVLKPGGSLITYVGHYAVPDIMPLMTEHLRYWWMIAVNHNGNSARLPGKWVFVQWKPLLWFVKGGRRDDSYVADAINSKLPDKEHHEWQQDETEARYYIERLTIAGETVLDPFMGGATTGVAALALGRKFIGIELDAERFAVAKGRISNAQL